MSWPSPGGGHAKYGLSFFARSEVKWAIRLLQSENLKLESLCPTCWLWEYIAWRSFRTEYCFEPRRRISRRPPNWNGAKKSDAAAKQVISCLGAKGEDINVLIAYAYPPDAKGTLERRTLLEGRRRPTGR